MKKIIGTILMSTLLLVGCGYSPDELVVENTSSKSGYTELIKNELYYIENGGSNFATKYSYFIASNSELEVFDVEILPNGSTHNGISGYYIFTKKK